MQLAHEFHANMARFILLAMHDVYMLFEIENRTSAFASKLLLRDPFQAERYEEELFLRSLLPAELFPDIWSILNSSNSLFETAREYSILEILVAGLVLEPNSADIYVLQGELDRPTIPVGESSSTPQTTPGSQRGSSSRSQSESDVNIMPSSALGRMMDGYSLEPRHHLSTDFLRQTIWTIHALWSQLTNDKSSNQSLVSTESDRSAGTVPSLPQTGSMTEERLLSPISISPRSADGAIIVDDEHEEILEEPTPPSSSYKIFQHHPVNSITQRGSTPQKRRGLGLPSLPVLVGGLPSSLSQARIILDSALSVGRLWDVYTARIGDEARPSWVAKICDPWNFPNELSEEALDNGDYTASMAQKHIRNNIILQAKSLADLQGSFITRLLAVYDGLVVKNDKKWQTICLVEEKVETPYQDW